VSDVKYTKLKVRIIWLLTDRVFTLLTYLFIMRKLIVLTSDMSQFVSEDDEKELEEKEQDKIEHGRGAPNGSSSVVTFKSPAQQDESRETVVQPREETMPPRSDTSAENYEFAVHGLLALGSGMGIFENAEMNYSPRPRTGDHQSTLTDRDEMNIAQNLPIFEGNGAESAIQRQTMQTWQSMDVPISDGFGELPQERVLELLKHYRYEIAPRVGSFYYVADRKNADRLVKVGHL
jgi:hypothetical protein